MTTDRFAECLAFTLQMEGGFSNDIHDPGGATQHGITLKTFRDWRKNQTATVQQLHDISEVETSEIYYNNYWQPAKCQDLPPGADLIIFDMAVNAGPRASIHILQRVLNVAVDGLVGPITTARAYAAGRPLIASLAAAQDAYYRKLPGFVFFGRGWLSRTARRTAAATLAFDAVPEPAAADAPLAVDLPSKPRVVTVTSVPASSPDEEHAIAEALKQYRNHLLNKPELATVSALPAEPAAIEADAPLIVEPIMVEIPDVVAAGLKGALAGAPLGPVGAGAGAAVGLAIQLVPSLTRWIAGDGGETVEKIVGAVEQITGSSNPAAQQAAIADPQVAGDLAVQLAQIVSEREAAHETATLETFKAGLADVSNARQTTVALAAQGDPMEWAAPVLSIIIIAGFIAMIFVIAKVVMPIGSGPLANVLLGTLSAMAIQVANFYLGSSTDSRRKTTLLANSVPSHLLPAPAVVLPATAIAPASVK